MREDLSMAAWQFHPRYWSIIVTAAAIYLFLELGFWQLRRAAENQALYESRQMAMNAEPVDISALPTDGRQWRKVLVRGEFREEPQILLDNQVLNGAAGYHVFAFFNADSGEILLVNRGWVSAGGDRRVPPALSQEAERVELLGILKPVPFSGIRLRDLPPEVLGGGIWRVHDVNLTRLGERLNIPLGEVVLRLEPESAAGYMRVWRNSPNKAHTNRGYAFQWFSFAGVALVLFFSLNLGKQKS
ncbi:MAG: SURF1 family protein [Candidatus Eutrophobiaceae bacterium]